MFRDFSPLAQQHVFTSFKMTIKGAKNKAPNGCLTELNL